MFTAEYGIMLCKVLIICCRLIVLTKKTNANKGHKFCVPVHIHGETDVAAMEGIRGACSDLGYIALHSICNAVPGSSVKGRELLLFLRLHGAAHNTQSLSVAYYTTVITKWTSAHVLHVCS